MSKNSKTYAIHLGLFILTFITTTYAGAGWQNAHLEGWEYFLQGMWFSVPLLLILTAHEFGHYLYAKKYKVDVSLPYFIPFIPIYLGTMGAIIRMRSQVPSRKQVFDIGIAGPLAGLAVAIVVLIIGFSTLPPREHIYKIHPDYKRLDSLYGKYENVAVSYSYLRAQDSIHFLSALKYDSAFRKLNKESWWMKMVPGDSIPKKFEAEESYEELSLGNNIIFYLFGKLFADPERLPAPFEIVHNPILMAAFFALFFTALNLFPIGQLDGGHVIYGLFGSKKHFTISKVIFISYIFVGGIGVFKNNVFGINVFQSGITDLLLFTAGYLYFLVQVFSRTFPNRRNLIMVAVLIMAGQFAVEMIVPQWEGLNGWLIFGFLLGRVLGIQHPPAMIDEPLSLKRKILGWSCIAIFILCFTPEPLVYMKIVP